MIMEYKSLGFRCGIEIHQQLEGKKLFCSCPTKIRKDHPDFSVERYLRASAGETGEIDRAAAHEQSKAKRFTYHGYHDSTCLVELDEEPPHVVNINALMTVLQLAALLNSRVVDEIQFMRKTVVDGSNTSGFQRTALVAVDGHIEVNGKKIRIPTVCLEEEAAQIIERKRDHDVYNLSRLGIPLIEIATDASISSPEECRDVAAKLGMILRSLKGIKRGIGSIRQDVNISIRNGARTEIKGFQEYRSIPAVIEKEVLRQKGLISRGEKVGEEVRKAEPDNSTSFLRPMPGAARMYPETDVLPVVPKTVNVASIELIDEKASRLAEEYAIPKWLAAIIAKKGIPFEDFVKRYKRIKPLFIAETLVTMPKEMRRRFGVEIEVTNFADNVLMKLDSGKITKEAVFEILVELGKGNSVDYSKFRPADMSEVESEIRSIVEKNRGAPLGAIMGEAMKRFRGKVEGKTISDLVKKLM